MMGLYCQKLGKLDEDNTLSASAAYCSACEKINAVSIPVVFHPM